MAYTLTTNKDKRRRNWQKSRLTGFSLDITVMTEFERSIYNEVLNKLNILKTHWDSETEALIGHPLPPHKCQSCGKRSNKSYILDGDNYCAKHYKSYYNE